VRVVANGDEVELADGATVEDLLHALGLGAKFVIAERNGDPVERRRMGETVLADGDRIELVRAVAGG
jgi:sulfur carrier protein